VHATVLPAARPTTAETTTITPVGRRLAVTGLVVGAVLNTAEAVLAQLLPARPESIEDQLRLVAEHSTLYGVRAVLGTVAVPFMAIAFLAAARVLTARARRTGIVAGTLLLAGMWGFVGIHLLGLLQLPASADPAGAAPVLEAAQSSPVLAALFLVPFLAGTALGMLVLTVGLLRTGAVARWIPAAWLVFLLIDFSVGAVGPVDPHWLWLAGAVGMAVHVARNGVTARTESTAGADADRTVVARTGDAPAPIA
jgi:hypothetical protein